LVFSSALSAGNAGVNSSVAPLTWFTTSSEVPRGSKSMPLDMALSRMNLDAPCAAASSAVTSSVPTTPPPILMSYAPGSRPCVVTVR
jgi:hypothetical protein